MAKVLVTGGAGFIGSHLVDELLVQGHQVTVIDNLSVGRASNLSIALENHPDALTFIEADISGSDLKWVAAFANVDTVFHLAARADIVPSIDNPKLYFDTNVGGTVNVLHSMKEHGVKKIIYAASSSCYGIPDSYPTNENNQIDLQYPYAASKYFGEQAIKHFAEVYQLSAISLRLFNVYGPRARTSGTYGAVFGVFLAQKLKGEPLTVVGDGSQTRDFTYVSDVVRAFRSASAFQTDESARKFSVYNVGSGRTVSVNKLVELLDCESVAIPKRPGEPDCTFADISLIYHELRWEPRIDIETGVLKMLEEIEMWSDAPVWNPDSIKQATQTWFKFLEKEKS